MRDLEKLRTSAQAARAAYEESYGMAAGDAYKQAQAVLELADEVERLKGDNDYLLQVQWDQLARADALIAEKSRYKAMWEELRANTEKDLGTCPPITLGMLLQTLDGLEAKHSQEAGQ